MSTPIKPHLARRLVEEAAERARTSHAHGPMEAANSPGFKINPDGTLTYRNPEYTYRDDGAPTGVRTQPKPPQKIRLADWEALRQMNQVHAAQQTEVVKGDTKINPGSLAATTVTTLTPAQVTTSETTSAKFKVGDKVRFLPHTCIPGQTRVLKERRPERDTERATAWRFIEGDWDHEHAFELVESSKPAKPRPFTFEEIKVGDKLKPNRVQWGRLANLEATFEVLKLHSHNLMNAKNLNTGEIFEYVPPSSFAGYAE